MAKPPNFSGYSLEQMKNLLKAEERRRNAISDWKLAGHTWGAVGLVTLVVALIAVAVVR